MKHSKRLLIPLLMLAPMLMANAPAPGVYPKSYDTFTCVYQSKEEVEEGRYRYSFNVSNTGEGYIDYIHLQAQNDEIYGYLEKENHLFDNPLIAPGDTETRHLYGGDVDLSTLTINYSADAYTQFYDGFKTNKKDVVMVHEGSKFTYYVEVDLKSSVIKDNDYYYGFISEVTYQGEKYFSFHQHYSKGRVELGSFDTELDLEQFSLNTLTMVRSKAYKNYFITTLFIIFIVGAVLMVSGGIFAIIFFSIKKARRRKQLQA